MIRNKNIAKTQRREKPKTAAKAKEKRVRESAHIPEGNLVERISDGFEIGRAHV